MLGDGESPPLLLNCVWVDVEILEVVEEAAAEEGSAVPPSPPWLPLHDTGEVVVAEAVVLLFNDVVVVLEAELLVQLFAPPTP